MCYRCNRKGHYSARCMSNTVAPQTMNVHEVSSQLNHPQLETSDRYLVTVEANKQNIWAMMIQIQGKPIVVKVEVIKHCQAIGRDKVSLYGPDQTHLKILGKINLTLSHYEKCCAQDVYIIKDLKSDLLGLPAIKELKLLLNVCSVENGKILFHSTPRYLPDWEHLHANAPSN